jgi:hypothetical protein
VCFDLSYKRILTTYHGGEILTWILRKYGEIVGIDVCYSGVRSVVGSYEHVNGTLVYI